MCVGAMGTMGRPESRFKDLKRSIPRFEEICTRGQNHVQRLTTRQHQKPNG